MSDQQQPVEVPDSVKAAAWEAVEPLLIGVPVRSRALDEQIDAILGAVVPLLAAPLSEELELAQAQRDLFDKQATGLFEAAQEAGARAEAAEQRLASAREALAELEAELEARRAAKYDLFMKHGITRDCGAAAAYELARHLTRKKTASLDISQEGAEGERYGEEERNHIAQLRLTAQRQRDSEDGFEQIAGEETDRIADRLESEWFPTATNPDLSEGGSLSKEAFDLLVANTPRTPTAEAASEGTLQIFKDFTAEEIYDHLSEAIWEHERSPDTSIWFSFWDRLNEGVKVPSMPQNPAASEGSGAASQDTRAKVLRERIAHILSDHRQRATKDIRDEVGTPTRDEVNEIAEELGATKYGTIAAGEFLWRLDPATTPTSSSDPKEGK